MAFWISLALSPYQLAASVSWGQFLAGLAFLPTPTLAVGTAFPVYGQPPGPLLPVAKRRTRR